MEDENDLDLSLALPCGGCPASWKSKYGKSLNVRTEKGDTDCKLSGDFKFLDGNTQKLDGISVHGSDRMKDEGNFFSNLSSKSVNIDASRKLSNGGFWTANDSRLTEVEEKTTEVGHKRKSLVGKSERDALYADLLKNTRTSNISINMVSGSTAENEDIANTEAEGSTSGPVSHHDDSSKQYDSSYADLTGKRRFISSSENEVKFGNTEYCVPFLGQPVNILNMPYFTPLKDYNPTGTVSRSSYPVPGMVPVMAVTGGERAGTQPIIPANVPPMFGYSPVMLPSLDKNNSYGAISHFQCQQLHPSYTRGPLNINKDNESLNTSQGFVSLFLMPFYFLTDLKEIDLN